MYFAVTFDILKLRLMYEKRSRMCPSRILHPKRFCLIRTGELT